MKSRFTQSFALLLLSVAVLSGCSKTDYKTKTELLTSKTWTLAYYGYDDNFNWTIESSESYMYSCEKDNVFTFKANGTLTEDEGTVKCGSAIGYSYDWQLSSDEKNIIIDSYRTYTIKTLDAYTLEVYYDYQSSNGLVRYIKKWVR
jgi:hypothetical protein